MFGFRLHQVLALLVLLAAAAWVLTGKFSHIGSERAGAEEAAPQAADAGRAAAAHRAGRRAGAERYSRAIRRRPAAPSPTRPRSLPPATAV